MSQTVTVEVKKNYKDGTVSVEVNGVSGEKCKDITAAFESAMGMVTSSEPTRDMYAVNEDLINQHN